MNRLHARIAVSEAAAWTARRFFGGNYRIIPNGVHLQPAAGSAAASDGERAPGELRILFIGQAVQRKGLPVLLSRLRGAARARPGDAHARRRRAAEEVAHMTLEDSGVTALGKVSEEDKLRELREADVLCAPSLSGESFGMVLTEAFAAATPVVASDIPGYRDVVRDGTDGVLTPPGDALALAEALRGAGARPGRAARGWRAQRARARRALRLAARRRRSARHLRAGDRDRRAAPGRRGRLGRSARRYGLAPVGPAAAGARAAPAEPAAGRARSPPAGAVAPPAGACARCAASRCSCSSLLGARRSPRWRCSASA